MRQLRFILTTLVILCCSFTAAAQGDFTSIDAFLKATLKGEDKLAFGEKGDLNSDGLEDWAGVIERKKGYPATTQLYVLLQLRQGGYRVAEKSKEAEIAGAGCCYIDGLEIRNSSIYIQDNAKADNTMEAVTHQFKLYQGKWRLIGIKSSLTDLNTDTGTDTDMNLLTGTVIEKRQKGENKPITRSRRKKFATFLLKDFDFDIWFGTGRVPG